MSHLKKLLIQLIAKLTEKRLTIATAESCTGGLIASYLTEQAGSSAWFERGFVTYSNLAKHDMLGVDLELIEQFGAVSEEVALAMVKGALLHSNANIAVAVTGIAGPTGGTLEKPVGTVCFAYALGNQLIKSERHFFNTSLREAIRLQSCQHVFSSLILLLDENDH